MGQKKSPAHFARQAQEAYELSLAGYSQRQIAEKMGVALATVQRRLDLYITQTTLPKAEEYRNQQIARCQIYIRSLWTQINAGDPKAIAAAVRTEERIAKLMGNDAATLFKVEATTVSRESDATEVQRMMDQYFGRDTNTQSEPKVIPHVDVTQRRRRPTSQRPPIAATFDPAQPPAPHNPETEFANDATFAPHEVHEEAIEFADDVEPEPAPRPRRPKKTPPNPAERFLRDSDDD